MCENKKRTERFESEVFNRDNYRCKVCNEGSSELFAHQITPELSWGYTLDNGITLCLPCRKSAQEARNLKPKRTRHNPVKGLEHIYSPAKKTYQPGDLGSLLTTNRSSRRGRR